MFVTKEPKKATVLGPKFGSQFCGESYFSFFECVSKNSVIAKLKSNLSRIGLAAAFSQLLFSHARPAVFRKQQEDPPSSPKNKSSSCSYVFSVIYFRTKYTNTETSKKIVFCHACSSFGPMRQKQRTKQDQLIWRFWNNLFVCEVFPAPRPGGQQQHNKEILKNPLWIQKALKY